MSATCDSGLLTNVQFNYCNHDVIYVDLPAPTNVKATVITSNSVEITWDQSSTVSGYLISCNTVDSNTSNRYEIVNSNSATGHTLTNLEENTQYTITVQSISNDDKKSVPSNEIPITTHIDGKSISPMHYVHVYVPNIIG